METDFTETYCVPQAMRLAVWTPLWTSASTRLKKRKSSARGARFPSARSLILSGNLDSLWDHRLPPVLVHPNVNGATLSAGKYYPDQIPVFTAWGGSNGREVYLDASILLGLWPRWSNLLASFFFSRNDPSRSNVNFLIGTIALQITLNLPPCSRKPFLGRSNMTSLSLSSPSLLQSNSNP